VGLEPTQVQQPEQVQVPAEKEPEVKEINMYEWTLQSTRELDNAVFARQGTLSTPMKPTEQQENMSKLEKVKRLISAYCRAMNIDPYEINEGTVAEKIGIRDTPISVIREALQQLRKK